MQTALSSLLLLIHHAKSGAIACMDGCDNYEKAVVYAKVLRMMGFKADVVEGSFTLKDANGQEAHLALSGVNLPEENIDFVSPNGEVDVEASMQALAARFRGDPEKSGDTHWLSSMGLGSIPVERFIEVLDPKDRMMQAIHIGHTLLQSALLEQDWPRNPERPRPRF